VSPERWRRVREVFDAALASPAGERDGFLAAACEGDGALAEEVGALLAQAESTGPVDRVAAWMEPLRRALEPEAPPAALGPYEVIGELGRGASGVVYRARDPRLGREVAIKRLARPLAADEAAVSRFLAEARAASALDHPHLCTVHDLGRDEEGRAYLVMTYYPGGTLADRLAQGPLPLGRAIEIASQVAAGLERAHRAGIVHRDVKPANIAFAAGGEAKVLDFGVAKLGDGLGTRAGTVMGTPRYMAPEQLRGDEVGPPADVWALAVVLYEMIAGRPPFRDAALTALAGDGQQRDEALARLPTGLPATVSEALRRGLAADPGERPPTAGELAAILDRRRPPPAPGRELIVSPEALTPAMGVRLPDEQSTVSGGHAADEPAPLPSFLSSFVGRERELAALAALLAEARLVTVTGPAGTGKTRLAVEAAARYAEAGGTVRFAGLATVRDPELVMPAIATALGVAPGAQETPLAAVARACGDRRGLLVLDNFEQVAAAVPEVGDLLARCPRLTVLATSRGPLRLAGERELPLAPLAPPPRGAGEAELAASPAARLFLERAAAVAPGFRLAAGEEDAVAEICRRLDGLPLALELAAARVRMLAPPALAAALRGRLDVLAGGTRDQPSRHRTLAAAIAWSHDLLSDDERRLFRRLAVFHDGFALEQAAAVTGVHPGELLPGLEALLDLGLLSVPAPASGGEPRFALLETLRVFARERLREAGEDEELRRAHLHAYRQLAERAAPELAAGTGQRAWLDRLEREHGNLRSALDRAPALPGAEVAALALATALWRFYLVRGRSAEGLKRLEGLLDRAAAAPPTLRFDALHGAATLAHNAGKNRRARQLLGEARGLAEELGDPARQLLVLNNLSWVAAEVTDLSAAAARAEEALALARRLGDLRAESVAHNNLGFVAAYREDWPDAEAHHRRSLVLRRRIEDRRGTAFALINLAWCARGRGAWDEAADLLDKSRREMEGLHDRVFQAWALLQEATLSRSRSDLAAARRLVERGFPAWRDSGNLSLLAGGQQEAGELALAEGDLAAAGEHLDEAMALWRRCGTPASWAAAACARAAAARAVGDTRAARRLARAAGRVARANGLDALALRIATVL
jgi:predicted ATPase/serine/threonine protein kinase